jgi:hypothetical protein
MPTLTAPKSKKDKRPAEKTPLSAEQRARQRESERAQAQAQAKQLAEQEALFKSRLAKITDEEAEAIIAGLGDSDKEKLARFTKTELRNLGYFKPEEGSAAWGKARRRVIKNLMAAGMTIGDIEEGE